MAFIGFYSLDLFVDLRTDIYRSGTEGEVMLTDKFGDFSQFCGICVGSSEKQSVTDLQKEFLLCHSKLGISMYRIKEWTKEQTMEEPNRNKFLLPPILRP